MTETRSYAQVCADRRERHRPTGCPGGQHYMRRDPTGPDDRPWKCRNCPHEQPWTGGIAAWMAAHAPRTPVLNEVPGQEALPLGLLALLRSV